MTVNQAIDALLKYALDHELITPYDVIYTRNVLLSVMKLDGYTEEKPCKDAPLETVLRVLCDDAVARGLIVDSVTFRDLFDTKLMGVLTPLPREVIARFYQLYRSNPEEATDYFYRLSGDTNYIRRNRVAKDMKWTADTEYGTLDITINLSKPEKDPKAIAAARNNPSAGYPMCQLCMENEGYSGRADFPARANHRIIPITIAGSGWGLQYSPYVYYNEHCIAFNGKHVPMKIERATFEKLLDFVTLFPHYFIGSNADLPIVGGSILSHDHFQGGRYSFAMEKSPIEIPIKFNGFDGIKAGIVKWPMSVIRISGENKKELIELADKILTKWRGYTDESAYIYAETDGVPHNTITPIARMRDGVYELDLVLRNNITTEEHPLGLYHPHAEYHHIKKENIGLIEVMGLAVLPSRLKRELSGLQKAILSGADISQNQDIRKHADWIEEIRPKYVFTEENTMDILKAEVGKVFLNVLKDAGVYKSREDFLRFISYVNQ